MFHPGSACVAASPADCVRATATSDRSTSVRPSASSTRSASSAAERPARRSSSRPASCSSWCLLSSPTIATLLAETGPGRPTGGLWRSVEQADPSRQAGGLGPVLHPEAPQQRGGHPLHGPLADEQPYRDLVDGEPVGQQPPQDELALVQI